MGEQTVSKFSDPVEKRVFTRHLLNDISALEHMLKERMFESGIQRIGAEQEICLVGKDWRPSMQNLPILEKINDPHFVTEIAKYNLEINLDPLVFKDDCFSQMEKDLLGLLKKGEKAAAAFDTKVILTGILPTIQRQELDFEYMTPNPRYEALNDIIRGQRGDDFELNITGIDEMITRHPNILFEACNTSFQVHLQVDQDEFVTQYNWAQAISGPVLAACANSPLLMGKRLWSETRIALFQQSMDTRNSTSLRREQEPRVSFGRDWLRGTVADMFKDNVSRYNLLFASDVGENSLEKLKAGDIPSLQALRIHNGTVYRWNRACYGISDTGKPHLRIENRYIPSGPTVVDELANTAFWLGLMKGMPEAYTDIEKQMSFEDARHNFYKAARTCLETPFRWFGKTVNAPELIKEDLLPIARVGLKSMQVDQKDINRLLGIIEKRVELQLNGSRWIQKNFSDLLVGSTPNEASTSITKAIYEYEKSGQPGHTWKNMDSTRINELKEFAHVSKIMTTDIFTVKEDDLLELVINVMDWRNIRYVPVENDKHELVGIITSSTLINYFKDPSQSENTVVSDIMETELLTVDSHASTQEAVNLMGERRVGCLPVVSEGKLVGLVEESDIVQVAKMTNAFAKKKLK